MFLYLFRNLNVFVCLCGVQKLLCVSACKDHRCCACVARNASSGIAHSTTHIALDAVLCIASQCTASVHASMFITKDFCGGLYMSINIKCKKSTPHIFMGLCADTRWIACVVKLYMYCAAQKKHSNNICYISTYPS